MWTIINGCKEEYAGLDILRNKLKAFSWFDLREMELNHCVSCGSCGERTPGQCVLKDDFESIARKVVGGEGSIWITPVTFGGYGSLLKNYIDRTLPFGLPMYYTEKGKMLHPMRYALNKMIVIGITNNLSEKEKSTFRLHVERNALNTQSDYQIILVDEDKLGHVEIDFSDLTSYKEVLECL